MVYSEMRGHQTIIKIDTKIIWKKECANSKRNGNLRTNLQRKQSAHVISTARHAKTKAEAVLEHVKIEGNARPRATNSETGRI